MPDPFTALSLASCIAQFVEFGSKIVSEAASIYEKESSTKSIIVGYTPDRLVALARNIEQLQSQLKHGGNGPLSRAELALSKAAEDSLDEARKLEQVLIKIKRLQAQAEDESAAKAKKIWSTLMVAFQTVWKLDKIRESQKKLRHIRDEVNSHILDVMNAKLDRQDERIVEILTVCNQLQAQSINYDGSQNADGDGTTPLAFRHNDASLADPLGKKRKALVVKKAEAVTAILTSSTGGSTTITRCALLEDGATNQSHSQNTDTMHPHFIFRRPQPQTSEDADDDVPITRSRQYQSDGTDFSQITQPIVDALHFRMIDEREEIIPEAYQTTFEWIWQPPKARGRRWTNFTKWLTSGSGVYWISGKAGSGKSTLMKYIHQHPSMEQYLRRWCGSNRLIIASFFFWRAGTALQKTQAGLLRSLLFATLESRRDLVPVLFPALCRTIATKRIANLSLSFNELRKATLKLLSNVPAGSKMLILIDGIDEYEGDHSHILDLFTTDTCSAFVKTIISSRPIPVCEATFVDSPSLRLQDLTVGDIQRYVTGKLAKNKMMRQMESTPEGQGASQQLVDEITTKASGVFLWVMLVVKSLLEGLQNSDTRQDLLDRLRRLPPDLEALYRHMLRSMSFEYQRQASLIIQLVMRSAEIQQSQMTVLQLSFAEAGDARSAFRFPIQALPERDENAQCRATVGRMRSRCCGFVESRWLSRTSQASELYVDFLHRTVVDFLKEPVVTESLKKLTRDSSLNLDEVLLSSNLKEMKVRPDRALESNMPNILAYASHIGVIPQSEYLDHMEAVARHYTATRTDFVGWAWLLAEAQGTPKIDPSWDPVTLPRPFLVLLAVHGLHEKLQLKLRERKLRIQDKILLLTFLILSFIGHIGNPDAVYPSHHGSAYLASIRVLLEGGQDPNMSVLVAPASLYVGCLAAFEVESWNASNRYASTSGQLSPWACTVEVVAALRARHPFSLPASMHMCMLLQYMLNAGADLKLCVRDVDKIPRTAAVIIGDFIRGIESNCPNISLPDLKAALERNRRGRLGSSRPTSRKVPSSRSAKPQNTTTQRSFKEYTSLAPRQKHIVKSSSGLRTLRGLFS